MLEEDSSFPQFDKTFMRLKQDHTIIGLSITQEPFKIQSLWLHKLGKRFYLYYAMSESKFRDRCQTQSNLGFQLFDVATYFNQFQQL